MTLGQKLAGYRKLSGLTQQQLGERLNISAQAISKWEKDLSEPALATLRTLADLYKVSVDELLDPEAAFDVNVPDPDEEAEAQKESAPSAIGFCKDCGITVSEENLGTTKPVVLCKACLEERNRAEREAQEKERREREEAIRRGNIIMEGNRRRRRNHRTLALCIAAVVAVGFLVAMIIAMASSFSGALIPTTVIGLYIVFAFVFCMFYECLVQDVVWDWFTKSLNLPGLIFTFDLDGFVWLIGMKILFWFIGLIFGIVTGAIGIAIGLVCAPFVFPFLLRKEAQGIAAGEELE